MTLVVKDRVQETTGVVGTGTITLGGATLGFQSFAAIGNANTTYYVVFDAITGDWEVGIGTYTASGTTLSRTTVLSSSNSGALVSFSTGTKQVICSYPSERAVYLDSTGTNPVQNIFNALTATTATITGGTVSTAPVNPTDIVNKDYADSIATGVNFHAACNLTTTTALPTCTYNNGASGVGATLTATVNGALSVDSVSTVANNRVLVKNQVAGAQNGIYVVTNVGTAGTPFILTRATDYDSSGSGTNEIDQGDYVLVLAGAVYTNTSWVQQTALPIVVGTTALVFLQFGAPTVYSAGTGLNLSPSTTFNISSVGTAGTYGSASNVPVITTNAQGQVTSTTNTGIAIASTAVSGLAASATTDTTNAANISLGTLPTGRISGSYTGLTGTGALAAGSLASGFTAVSAPLGGTGQTSYAVGDLIYADTTTSLAKLADIAVGSALISGGVGSAPTYGKIGLATHVSGTLPVLNGGTGVTSSTGSGSTVLSTSPTLITPALGTPSALVGTNITGTATAFTASNVTTNANLTGNVTSIGNATTLASIPGISGASLTSLTAANISAGTAGISVTGNAATVTTNANLTGNVTSVGNATTLASIPAISGASLTSLTAANISAGTAGISISGNAATATNVAYTGLTGVVPTWNQSTTGNAATATTATTATTANALATGNNYQVNSLGVGTGPSGTAGEIRATNNITAFYSDERLKTKTGNIENALDKICHIETMLYHANEVAVALGYDASIQEVGVTAQSVQKVQPEIVVPAPIDDRYLTVRYEKLVPLLIEAIKELNAKVDKLTTELNKGI